VYVSSDLDGFNRAEAVLQGRLASTSTLHCHV
jgi:hypothetical protein